MPAEVAQTFPPQNAADPLRILAEVCVLSHEGKAQKHDNNESEGFTKRVVGYRRLKPALLVWEGR